MVFPKEKASAAALPISCTQQGAHTAAPLPPGSGGGSSTSSATQGWRWLLQSDPATEGTAGRRLPKQTGNQDPPSMPGRGAESKNREREESLILLLKVEEKDENQHESRKKGQNSPNHLPAQSLHHGISLDVTHRRGSTETHAGSVVFGA